MKKAIGAVLLFMATQAIKGRIANPAEHLELARLRISLAYVRSIKTCRLLFLSMLSMGVCLVFLVVSLVLLHVSLFLYAPWSDGTKMMVGLICSAIYLLATLIVFYQIFASDNWLKIFNAEALMPRLNQGDSAQG